MQARSFAMPIREEPWEGTTICSFLNSLVGLHKDEGGQGLVEYVLILALVALAAIATMKNVGNSINRVFTKIGSTLNSAIS